MYIKDTKIPRVLYKVQSLSRPDSTLLFLLAENSNYDIPALIEGLNVLNINFVGAVFPGLIYGEDRYDKGIVVKSIDSNQTFLCRDTNTPDFQLDQMDDFITNDLEPHSTALILMDGLMDQKQSL